MPDENEGRKHTVVILSKSDVNVSACVAALAAHGERVSDGGVIVVDDGLSHECIARLAAQGVRVVAGQKPFIFARNANVGIRAAHCDVVLLNDDALLLTDHGLTQLAAHATRVGAAVCSARVDGKCGNSAQRVDTALPADGDVTHQTLAFIATYISHECWTALDGLDERFDGYGYEDDDFCTRASCCGFKLAVAPPEVCTVRHQAGESGTMPSFRSQPDVARLKAHNAKLFDYKWTSSEPALSILIPSVTERHEQLEALRSELARQRAMLARPGDVEIVILISDVGSEPLGAKRNKLLELARGGYVAFIDDDDEISKTYLQRALLAIQSAPDCVTFQGRLFIEGAYAGVVDFNINNPAQKNLPGMYLRSPNHLCPTRRELALQARFPEDKTFGEDSEYATRLHPLLKTQVRVTGESMYDYMYSPKNTLTQRGVRRPAAEQEALARI